MTNLKNILFAVVLLSGGLLFGDVYTDNVVVVIDTSGSMAERMPGSNKTKMQAAIDTLELVIKQLPKTTHIGLLSFSTGGRDDEWIYPLGKRKDGKLSKAINSLKANGGTPLGEYIKYGADRLLKARKKQHNYGSYRLLVVTDGEASDERLMDKYVPDVMSRGIAIDAIGVAMDKKHTLANKVSSYRSADNPESFKKAVEEVFAEVAVGDNGSSADAESFALIQGLPDGIPKAIIEGFSNTKNHPIGTVEKASQNKVEQSTVAQTTNQQVGQSNNNNDTPPLIILAFLVLAVLIVLCIVFGLLKDFFDL